MIERVQLTPAITGLGDLHEPALLALIADVHYRILTRGQITPREIVNKAGEPLYPSIFALHVQVPAERSLEQHALWQSFDLGVDVRSFGRQFLAVDAVIGNAGELPDDVAAWGRLAVPSVRWSGAWTTTRPDGQHELANPSNLPELPRLTALPPAIASAREALTRGAITTAPPRMQPIHYHVHAGRDAAPGRQIMFSQFVVIADAAERTFLTDRVYPAFPASVLDLLSLRERKIFYYANCRANDAIETFATATLRRVDTSASITSSLELINARTKELLALVETTKSVAILSTQPGVLQTIERLLARHGEGRPLNVEP